MADVDPQTEHTRDFAARSKKYVALYDSWQTLFADIAKLKLELAHKESSVNSIRTELERVAGELQSTIVSSEEPAQQ